MKSIIVRRPATLASALCGVAIAGSLVIADGFALVSDYYGAVGYIPLDENGSAGPVSATGSPDRINQGSYGIGVGDFDNDGLDDYLIGGVGSNGLTTIEFHKRTGTGNSFAAGVPISGAGGWYYYVMDYAVADYDRDGNLDFAVSDYNFRAAHVYRGHGDGTFTKIGAYSTTFMAIAMDAADVNNDGNTDFVATSYYETQYCYYNTQCSNTFAVFLGNGNGGFTRTVQTVTFAHPTNAYYYNYAWGLAVADFDGDGRADAAVTDYRPFGGIVVFRGNGDGTFQNTPIRTSLNDNYYLLASIDNEDIDGDGIQDLVYAAEGHYFIRTLLGNGDGTFRIASTQNVSGTSWLTGISTRPGDGASDRRAPVVVLDAIPALTNNPALVFTGTATDAGGIVTLELVHDGSVVGTLAQGNGGAFTANVTLVEGVNNLSVRATDRAGNVGESPVKQTRLDTQPPAVALAPLPQFAVEASFALSGTASDDHALAGVVVKLNGGVISSALAGGNVTAQLTLVSGTNTIELIASDLAGNSRSATGQIIFDSAGPTVTLAALPEFTNVATHTVTGTARDDNGIASLVVTVNGAQVGSPFSPAADGSFHVDVQLGEGPSSITVKALDRAGLSGSATIATVLDTVPPVASLAAFDEYTNNAALAAAGTVVDATSGVATATLRVADGAASGNLVPDASGAVAAALALTEGRQTIVLEARDRAGNIGATSREIVLDTIRPSIAILTPFSGQPFGATAIAVSAEVHDASPTTVTFGGHQFQLRDGATLAAGIVDAPGEGPQQLRVEARDAAGNVAHAEVSYLVDLSAPVADLDMGVADGASIGPQPANQLLYTLHVDDLTEVVGTVSWAPAFSHTFAAGGGVLQGVAPLVEGRNVFSVRLVDELGHESVLGQTVVYDVTGPRVTPFGVLASPGTPVRGTVELAADATDNLTGVATAVFEIDGVQTPATATAGSFTAAIDTSALADGRHAVRATFSDGVGNTTVLESWMLVDNTAPVAQIAAPAAGAYVRQAVAITATASDATSGLAGLDIAVNGRTIGSCASSPCTVSFDTTTLANGEFLITATATDAAGNTGEPAKRTALADNSAPSKFLVSPITGAVVTGSTTLTVNVVDDAFASVECFVDGVSLGVSTSPTFSATIDVLAKLDGALVVSCSAADLAGNVGTESATVQIRNWKLALDPQTLNLKSSGAEVKLEVTGPNLSLLLPTGARALTLVVAGGSPTPLVAKRDGYQVENGALALKFDRPALVAAIKAGIAAGAIDPAKPVTVRFMSNSRELGSQTIRVIHSEGGK